MNPTYRIDTQVGESGRWLASIEEAKAKVIADAIERWQVDEESYGRPPEFDFVTSTEDDDGNPCPEHILVYVNENWDCTIRQEQPAWPSYELGYGDSPDLVMSTSSSCPCRTPRLVCSNLKTGGPEEAFSRTPSITCAGCGCTWTPEGETP